MGERRTKLRKFVENVDQTERLNRKRAWLNNDARLLVIRFKKQCAFGASLSGPIIKTKAKILAKTAKALWRNIFWSWRRLVIVVVKVAWRWTEHNSRRKLDQLSNKLLPRSCTRSLKDEQIYNADKAAFTESCWQIQKKKWL